MYVKIFKNKSIMALEKEVQEFLNLFKNIDIIKIIQSECNSKLVITIIYNHELH